MSSPSNSSSLVNAIPRGSFPWWLLQESLTTKTIVILPEEEDVLSMVDDIRGLQVLPDNWVSIQRKKAVAYDADDEIARQVALHSWLTEESQVLVCSQEGLVLPCDEPETLLSRAFLLRPGLNIRRTTFEDKLLHAGYSRAERCEQSGEYAIRGDVIDIWPASEEEPIRILWNFDEIEGLRKIDLHTQMSGEFLREMWLHPITAGKDSTLEKIISQNTQVIRYPEDTKDEEMRYAVPPTFVGHMELLREQLQQWHEDDWRVAIFCHNQGECDRLTELLIDPFTTALGQKPNWEPKCLIAEVEHGFVDQTLRLAVLTNAEIFGRYRKRVRVPKFSGGAAVTSPLDITKGDFLVHEKHGIGRYVGLQTLKVGRVTSEFLAIEYKSGDKLYVPIFELQQVQKYLGAEGKRPALSSLDSPAWEKTKSKVKEEVAKLAAELLKNAAKRSLRPGYAFPPVTHLEKEFANSFMYTLTDDQKKTLEEVERDMQSAKAMDRLICGDVGYGKTEVAMRAALKAALAAKQVCLLCPTTILAEQHYRNFSERMADYPVVVKLLSRFQEKSEQQAVIESVGKGSVDIVIGTHRLLSSDVNFKDLGLLVIDEEHRFGVKQKNQLLALRANVDVLSLTATPIPRTLASSLGGLKDLSVIETPPQGRMPISTFVGLFDEDLMVQAVQQELDRGGQVFYVHNRVKTLLARKEYLEKLLPNVRVVMAHGQFGAAELEQAMFDFLHKKVNILLATTIIESGLDIPSVNTLIVEEAEEMGLAQLYQLRGRVGRSNKKAYCYLFYSMHNITSEAKKRLQALKEYTALGSGFRLAMRDMEIRGAGNLLGPQQHGSMAAVGIETYSRLLNEEIQRQKGDNTVEESKGPLLELELAAYIPDEYLPSEVERVMMYKRILSAGTEALVKIKEELIDRCGTLPESVKLLFDTAALRLILGRYGVSEVQQEEGALLIYFKSHFKIPEKSFNILIQQSADVLTLIPGSNNGVRFFVKENEPLLDALGRFLRLVFTIK